MLSLSFRTEYPSLEMIPDPMSHRPSTPSRVRAVPPRLPPGSSPEAPFGSPVRHLGRKGRAQAVGAEPLLVVGQMQRRRDDAELGLGVSDPKLGLGELAVDGEGGGAVFEDAVLGPLVSEHLVVDDGEAILGPLYHRFLVG
ncbi:hypothetical protein PG997_010110 [Apiospora hydei]|uniref:Uncharacterized protein n=1 Tax=Apiospora hydei TaxID=1337664 RepID=A0ABR1VW74_9PEZI